jgi:hypothetical protein
MLFTVNHIAHWDLVNMSKLWMAEQEVASPAFSQCRDYAFRRPTCSAGIAALAETRIFNLSNL